MMGSADKLRWNKIKLFHLSHTHTTARVEKQPSRWGEYKLEQTRATKHSSLLPSLYLCSDHSTICLSPFYLLSTGVPGGSAGKESACNAGDPGSIPGVGKSPGEGIGNPVQYSWASFVAELVKNLPGKWETWIPCLGWEDPLEKGRLPTSVFWPGEFHGLYSSWGHKELDRTE